MTRSELHHLVDRLPEDDLDRAASLVVALQAKDRVALQSLLAEEVEPEPDELGAASERDHNEPTVSARRSGT